VAGTPIEVVVGGGRSSSGIVVILEILVKTGASLG
jgi:hypothetical protein